MNNRIKLSDDFLDKLSDEEIYLLIDAIPNEQLLYPIKKYPKEFREETKGCWINEKSKMLINRLPSIYFNRIKKSDGNIIEIVRMSANNDLIIVNEHIFEVTSDENFLNKTIASNDIGKIRELMDIISEQLRPEYIKLFFKLMDQELSDEQNNYIDKKSQKMIIERGLREEISKELAQDYKVEIKNIKDANKVEKQNQDKKIKKIEKELNNIKAELSRENRHSSSLMQDIEKIKTEKDDEINVLEKHIEKLCFQIDNIENERLKLKFNIEKKDLIIENLNKDLELRYDEYCFIAQEKWNIENESLLKKQKNLEKNYNDLEKIKNELVESIRELEVEKVQLEDKISEYKNITYNFIDNIDKKLIEKALYDSLLKYNSNNLIQVQNIDNKSTNLYIKKNERATNINKCIKVNDFAENIAINLENIGVKSTADEVANYIIGILAAGMTPLICGYKAREIATAISTSYSGETPYIITLPNGYTNSKELVEIYNLAESNVVLIEDAVGTMNENALMPLLRERAQKGFLTKILLLSTENIDSIKYMPSNLLNQVALVMISKYDISKNTDYEISDARDVLEQFTSLNSFKNEYRIIEKLLFNLKLGNPYEILRSKIIAYSQKLSNSKAALQGYLRSELMFICSCNNTLVNLENNIKKYQLDDSLVEIIRRGLDE
ncbi:hypothetical protein [Clostridium sp. Cult2]|uniref:hypothetical protein n=1 Tax=Clostridium sp. Cult2 TaxID=2079003 RepID=UPI001F47E8C9|nr:hypothetical protein [Clostridium sp. Cult2]MCF6465581.1 hypothetical protein [Clostridium sp. Cult2]